MLPRLPLLAFVGALTVAAGQAHAETPAQGTAVVTPLGSGASALTYWVDGPEGFRVVTTVDTVRPGEGGREDRHAVVRLSTVLRPGQTQTVSVPGPDGVPLHAMRLRRLAGGVEVLPAGPESLTD
jgi:hypothetical protein